MSAGERVLLVTPTLGSSPHLAASVASVASLSLPIRHLVVAPPERVAEVRRRFPHAEAVGDRGPEGGLYGALNAALDAARGEWDWFTYLNDDDLLLPGFAAMVRRHTARAGREPVAYGDVEMIREDGLRLARVTTERSPSWIPALLQQGISPLMQQGMAIDRATVARLGGFDTRYRLCADLDFWLRALASGCRFRHHALPVAQFRLRAGQLSSDTALTMREQDEIVRRHLPARLPAPARLVARWRYRLLNLPRYWGRVRRLGPRRSYEILASGAGPRR